MCNFRILNSDFPKIAAFRENPEKNWSNLAKIQQKFSKFFANFATFCKNQQKNSAIFYEKIEIRERCKGVHCVDLGESFPTSIYLQNLASTLPRTSPIISRFRALVNLNLNFEVSKRLFAAQATTVVVMVRVGISMIWYPVSVTIIMIAVMVSSPPSPPVSYTHLTLPTILLV